jgi:hypothetical protein
LDGESAARPAILALSPSTVGGAFGVSGWFDVVLRAVARASREEAPLRDVERS